MNFIKFIFILLFINNVLADPIIWNIQSGVSKDSSWYKDFNKLISRPVYNETKGQLIINLKAHHPSVNNFRTFNDTKFGISEGMFMTPQYWSEKSLVFEILGDVSSLWSSPKEYEKWLDNGGDNYLKKEYAKDGLKFLGYTIVPSESLVSHFNVCELENFKGKVIRTPPGIVKKLFQSLGASVRTLSTADIKPALKAKKILATDYSTINANNEVGFYKVAKQTNYPGFHSMPMRDIVVNLKAWNSLDKKYQKILLRQIKRWSKESRANHQQKNLLTIKDLIKEKVVVCKISQRSRNILKKKVISIVKSLKGKSVESDKLIEDILKTTKSF